MRRGIERTFSDADLFRANIRAGDVDLLLPRRGTFDGSLTQIDFEHLWMQRGYESLARVARATLEPGRVAIFFTYDQRTSFVSDGVEIRPDTMILYGPGQEFHQRSEGHLHWGAMSLAPDYLAEIGQRMRTDLPPLSRGTRFQPPADSFRRLHYLHRSAVSLLRNRPAFITRAEPSHAIEVTMIEAFLGCLTQGRQRDPGSIWRHRTRIIGQLEALLEANQDRPLYMLEICEALGVRERTLQLCCRDYLGMSPMRYLRLRRLHLARRALRQEDRTTASVTDIATRFGFWELGRFAVEYRRMFGETPSATLRRPAEDAARMRPDTRPHRFSETA